MTLSDSTAQKVETDTRRNEAEPPKSLDPERKRRRSVAISSSEFLVPSTRRIRDILENRRMRRAGGGIIKLQEGGRPTRRSRGYRSRALPEGYAMPQGYEGYGRPGSFTERQEYVAPELASQYADITQGIMDAGTRTYDDIRYRGPRLAGFSPEEQAYKAAVTRIGTGEGPRATRQAEQTIGEAARGIGSVATAAGAPSLLKDADLSPYESQYTQGVIDPQIRAIREAARQQAAELGSSAAQAGAFGGYRHGLQEQAIGQQEIQQIGDVTAKGAEEAFRSAQAAQQQDAAAEAAAREQQMAAFGRLGATGQSQMQLGQQMGDAEMRRLQAMRDAGMDTRKLQQTAYDIQKAEFEKEMQHPERQLKFMTGMLGQLPYQNITREGVYAPQAGVMSEMTAAGADAASNVAAYQQEQNRQNPASTIPNRFNLANQGFLNQGQQGQGGFMNTPAFGGFTLGNTFGATATPASTMANQFTALGGVTPSGGTSTSFGGAFPTFSAAAGLSGNLGLGAQTTQGSNFMNPNLTTSNPIGDGNYGGGIIGMRNSQIASRLGGGMIPMHYGG